MLPENIASKRKAIVVVLSPVLLIGLLIIGLAALECRPTAPKVSLTSAGCIQTTKVEECICGLKEKIVEIQTDCSSGGEADISDDGVEETRDR